MSGTWDKDTRGRLPDKEVLTFPLRTAVSEPEERAFQVKARARNLRPAELLRLIFREWMENNR